MAKEPLTWEELKSLDDIVTPQERVININLALDSPIRCPLLKKDGEHFYYCGAGIPEGTKPELNPGDPIYKAKISSVEMQLWCMHSYESCVKYKEAQKAQLSSHK